MTLSEISVQRPVTAVVMTAALLVFGFLGLSRLGIDRFPKVDPVRVTVRTILPGASPEVVEEDVTAVLEEQINTIPGIRSLTSMSAPGASMIMIEFDLSRDIDQAASDIREKVSAALGNLPRDAEPPIVDKQDLQAQPILWAVVFGDRPIAEVTEFAKEEVKKRLERISGVGSVLLGGKRERVIRIWLSRERMEAFGLTVSEIREALSRENVEAGGGTIEGGSLEFSVRTQGEIKEVTDFGEIVVASRAGRLVRLSNVARVEDGLEDLRGIARYNGQPAVGLGVQKQSGANTVRIAQRVREEIEEAKRFLPPGLSIDVSFDSSTFITDSVREMEFSLVLAAALTTLVVFFFLLNFRSTLFVGLAIPISIIATFGMIYFLGFTLNTMTLLSLSLSVGIVVDDAIVVLENIFRHRQEGKGARRAALEGSREITFAAMASTFAIAAVFLPVAFMRGASGRFFYEFGVTVTIAVLVSLFVSLTLIPMLCSRFLVVSEGAWPRLRRGYLALENWYTRRLAAALRHRGLVLVAALLLFALSLLLVRKVGSEFTPSEDVARAVVRFETPIGSSLEYTDGKVAALEKVLAGRAEVKGRFAAVGLSASGRGSNKGMIFVRLLPKTERKMTQAQIITLLRREFSGIPGVRAFVEDPSAGFGAQRGSPLEFYIKGPSLEGLGSIAGAMVDRLRQIPGVVDINTNLDVGLPEVRLYIDRDRAADLGVEVSTIASAVSSLVGGEDVTRFKDQGKRYDVRLKLAPSDRSVPGDLGRILVRNRDGRLIRLESLVRIVEGSAASVINRRDRERAVTVFANLEGGKRLGSAIKDVRAAASSIITPPYRYGFGGQAELSQESSSELLFALALAVVIAYMILASQFESFLQAANVMLTLPLAAIGAFVFLWVFGQTLNVFSMIGIILLTGIVKKNAILLVDYANTIRSKGGSAREAILTAAPVRLRPILMTAITTIAAAVPTAFGIGPGSESRAPMAMVVVGGMFAATLLPLFVIPVTYSMFEELKEKLARRQGRRTGLSGVDTDGNGRGFLAIFSRRKRKIS